MISWEAALEAETLARWVHEQDVADTTRMGLFLARQLAEAKEQAQEYRGRHATVPWQLTQAIEDLGELQGICADHLRTVQRWTPEAYSWCYGAQGR